MTLTKTEALITRLRTLFTDRELIIRTQGHDRIIRVSSRMQLGAATAGLAIAGICAATIGTLALDHAAADHRRAALQNREAQVARAQSDVDRYRANLDKMTADLQRRQTFIENLVDAHLGNDADAPSPTDTAATPTPSDNSAPAARHLSAFLPETDTLARLQAAQLAMVDRLTRYADARSDKASAEIRKLGLSPQGMMVKARAAQGGPLLQLTNAQGGKVSPAFRKLGASFARMDALENGLVSIPQVSPAHVAYVSSSYGYRSDPFTGASAFHPGLDFPGPMGSPIYAAAKGVVSFVGQRSGYGNCVEIDHGHGLMTRYGHLSRFDAHVGEKVDAGTVIAAMGSTGRSTGSHLHFEVRVNGRAVNPRPFLENAHTLQKQEAS